jgi:PhoH-like ATPase
LAKKNFVLDTNILLHDPQALNSFADNNIIIPMIVLEELDKFKKNENETGKNCRLTSRLLDELREKGSIVKGVELDNGGTIRVTSTYRNPGTLDMSINDNKILATALTLKADGTEGVVLVTNDINLRIKADAFGLPAEKFGKKKNESHSLFRGIQDIKIQPERYSEFGRQKWTKATADEIKSFGLVGNQYIRLYKGDTGSVSLARFDGKTNKIKKLIPAAEVFGIRALSDEQMFALDALLDEDIKLVSLVGQAGTGKTLLAVAAGLEKIVNQTKYSKLLVSRPVMPMGNDIGYLPGTVEEKLSPWMQPIKDNLDYLFDIHKRHTPKTKDKKKTPREKKNTHTKTEDEPKNIQERLVQEGILQVEALTYIRGRSIPNQYMIIDEAQNLTPHEIKTIITRAGEGTKIVLTGDTHQIDSPYLDELSNGLAYCVERMKGVNISAHVTLTQGERSELAEQGSKLL